MEKLRNETIEKYILKPEEIWLYELVHLDDWIVTARMELDESLECEHEGYVSPIPIY
jgi:hypothetical protein